MPQMPPMNGNQMMRQMQYTINETLKRVVIPMQHRMKVQEAVIRKLSKKIQEVESQKGSMSLDINKVNDNAMARVNSPTRETVSNMQTEGRPSIHSKVFETEIARSEILELDKSFRSRK